MGCATGEGFLTSTITSDASGTVRRSRASAACAIFGTSFGTIPPARLLPVSRVQCAGPCGPTEESAVEAAEYVPLWRFLVTEKVLHLPLVASIVPDSQNDPQT